MPNPAEFPTRDNCDPNNPDEFALWAFVAPPGIKGGMLMMPTSYYRLLCRRLWDLGFRHVEEPTLEWIPPQATDPNWLTSPGRWVPVGSVPKPSEVDEARASVARMSGQQKAELLAALAAGEPFDESPAGLVAESLSEHQRDVVLEVLREVKGAR